MPQYLVLLVLWEPELSGHTVKGLADALQLDASTVTPLLKRLQSAGFISRERDTRLPGGAAPAAVAADH